MCCSATGVGRVSVTVSHECYSDSNDSMEGVNVVGWSATITRCLPTFLAYACTFCHSGHAGRITLLCDPKCTQ